MSQAHAVLSKSTLELNNAHNISRRGFEACAPTTTRMASLDFFREQNQTYLKKQTAPDGRLVSLAKKYAQRVQLASAFDKHVGDGSDDNIAIRLLAAYHAPSAGHNTT